MGEIVDFERKLQEKSYNKILELIAQQKANVEEDPWPTISRLEDEIIYLRQIIIDINDIVNPLPLTHLESSFPEYSIDIRAESVAMVTSVREILALSRP